MNIKSISLILFLGCLLFISGCRGWQSDKPAIHPNPNMDWQSKYTPQDLSLTPPSGTVAWGNQSTNANDPNRADYLQQDTRVYKGTYTNGKWVTRIPTPVSKSVVLRGQDRYNIYCAVCHTKTGNGTKSLISKRGWMVADITTSVSRGKSDGELFNIVSHGIRTMPGYSKQLSVDDRWAIVSYVRALQKTRTGRLQDVPQELRRQLK